MSNNAAPSVIAGRAWLALLLLPLAIANSRAESRERWFQERVHWEAGREAIPWKATVDSPDGTKRYGLALVPLWAVEGGIVAIEIVVSRPKHPDRNLLGHRGTNTSEPFVITVEDLEGGIAKSRFGATRVFRVDQVRLRIQILGARVGPGLGECQSCIQELTAEVSLRSK
jgi:hypothetical protein